LPRKKQRGVPTLGERTMSLMEASKLNASELSARTGISVSYLTRIIQGEVVNPTIDFVIRIAAGLGVTESELIRPAEEAGRGRPAIAVAGAFGAGVGLGAILPRSRTGQQQTDTGSQQHSQDIGFLVKQIVAEAQLPPEKRILAGRLIEEHARAVCHVLAAEQDQQRR
jgi:transcriptional regulator with XRE-family HTH domain